MKHTLDPGTVIRELANEQPSGCAFAKSDAKASESTACQSTGSLTNENHVAGVLFEAGLTIGKDLPLVRQSPLDVGASTAPERAHMHNM